MTENSYIYSREEMPPTPGGRHMQQIEGEPGTISTRATQIEQLGEKMARAARTLELFADGTVGKGESFEAIREQAKEVHEDLRVAAARYRPSGAALGTYATALSAVQGSTDWRVTGARNAWPEVRDASWALSAAERDQDEFDRNEDREIEQTGTRPTTGSEQTTFDNAVDTWEMYWSGYDAPVETWESAYETACSSLERTNADGVKDSFWDNSMPFVEIMLDVLLVVGIVLLVVAFVVTGPLAMLAGVLAVVAGVLSLMGEIAKLNAGRGDWGSVALAAVGIIPFGKLAKLASLADFAQVGARFPRLSGAFRLGGSEFLEFGGELNAFLRTKIPDLFTNHGLNSQNLMRGLYMPSFLSQGNELVGGWAAGWNALAGNPQNLAEALGGSVDVMTDVMGILKDGGQKLEQWTS
ncbi:hypothetical protein N3K63_05360 [Microbacterium sp. W1N]|uniref:hypothetical protein n=1 Tax=Microbacterium festucae TaxID=2977531 RepID=UPI0021BFF417|nr:hypothetical protein [Microbacterium festucae]MCT9819713.1 hypothetical protein [Microbacterium festucae]